MNEYYCKSCGNYRPQQAFYNKQGVLRNKCRTCRDKCGNCAHVQAQRKAAGIAPNKASRDTKFESQNQSLKALLEALPATHLTPAQLLRQAGVL